MSWLLRSGVKSFEKRGWGHSKIATSQNKHSKVNLTGSDGLGSNSEAFGIGATAEHLELVR
jgi:hypothetical protein